MGSRLGSLLAPSGEDFGYGAPGGALAYIAKLHADNDTVTSGKGLHEKGGLRDLQGQVQKLDSSRAAAQRLADGATDPQARAKYQAQVKAYDGEIGTVNKRLSNLLDSSDKAAALTDSVRIKGAINQKLVNSGINNALRIGQNGTAIEQAALDTSPRIAKVGQAVVNAGVNIGNKLIASGTGRTAGDIAESLAPKLATVGEFALKRAGVAGAGLTIAQGIGDVMNGKSTGRATAETVGSLVGGAVGAVAVGALGSVVPLAGTGVGAAVGNVVGGWVGGKLGDVVANIAGFGK